jgi:hypothetical protein
MNKEDFKKMEYCTLREEIKETKSRIFKIAGLAIIGTPSAYFLGKALQMELFTLFLPAFICIILLFYLSESHALMRCGYYIKTNIENEVDNQGWENWLEQRTESGDRRLVDKLVNIFFNFIFIMYYIAAVFEADKIAFKILGTVTAEYIRGIYSGIFIIFIAIMIYSWPRSTSTGKPIIYTNIQEDTNIKMRYKKK